MLFTLEDIAGLRSGQYLSRQAGELRRSDIIELGWRNPIVYISAYSLKHIAEAHPDIGDQGLLLLPTMIRNGLLIRENAKPNYLIACYQHGAIRYCTVLKRSRESGQEIWVQSLRRMKPRQTKAMLRRGCVIRRHK